MVTKSYFYIGMLGFASVHSVHYFLCANVFFYKLLSFLLEIISFED